MTDQVKRRFSLFWESQGHAKVKAEADRVDASLDAVAEGVEQVTRRSEAGAKSVGTLGRSLNSTERRLESLDRATDKTAQGLDRLEQRAKGVAAGFKGVGAAVTAAIGAVAVSQLLDLAEEGAGLQLVSRRLEEVGFSAEKVADITNRLGGGSSADVERLVTRANEAGVAFEQMGTIADASLQLASARGLNSHEVMVELTKAVAAGEVGWLRQQGVIIDVAAAQRDYAKSIGKTTAELTEQDKVAASSQAVLSELNKAFDGKPPDKYASNIGAVRDRLDNLADLVKRKLADALNDLGAALSGGSFASEKKGTRLQQLEKQIAELERLEARLVEIGGKADLQAAEVFALVDNVGEDRARKMLGLPPETVISRVTAGYIDALGGVRRQIAAARERADVVSAEEDYQAQLAAEAQAAVEVQTKRAGASVRAAKKAIDGYTLGWMELGRVMEETGNIYLQYGKDAISLESFEDVALPSIDFDALGQQLADGLNAGLARVERIGDALGIGAAHDDMARLFETIGEHAANARSVLGDVSSTVGVMGQIGALESSNAVQRAKNRARDAKGQKEQIAAQKALLAAEKAAEQERRRMQALDFALKAADNAGAAIEEVAKAAGAYPDPVGMALHGFAALKHGAAAAFYGRGVSASLSAPSAVGGGGGLGPGTPSAPTAADRPVDNGDQRRGGTTIVLNGILADGRAVRTATTDALNTVGDGQIPIDTDGGL